MLQYTTVHYTIVHSTALHSTSLHCITLQLHYTTLAGTTLDDTPLHYATLNYTRLSPTPIHACPTYFVLHSLQHHRDNCNYARLIALHHNYNSIALLFHKHYLTLHPAVVGEVTTPNVVTTAKTKTPTTFRSISGFALPSVIHNTQGPS